jgi:hypothetical protein
VTRGVCEKIAQDEAQPSFVVKIMHNFYREKSSPKNLGYLSNLIKTTQSKQSSYRRK